MMHYISCITEPYYNFAQFMNIGRQFLYPIITVLLTKPFFDYISPSQRF